jgi:putative type-I specificity determinant subunit
MTNSKHVPKRRFPDFEGEWEQKQLDELSTHRSGTAIENYFSKNGLYKVISIGSYGLDGNYIDQGIRAISNEITDNQVVKKNELTMVLNDKTSNGTIIGRTLLIDSSDEFVVNQRTEIITPKNVFNPLFAFALLNGKFRDKVKKIVQGGTQIYVNYSSVKKLQLHIPNLIEQKQLGILFQTIDRLITLYQHKLDKLKNLKKSYLAELFPAEGERVPKRRFPGFEGEWEKKKLGEIMDVGSVKRVHQSDWRVNGVRFLRARDIVSEFKNAVSNDYLYIDEELYKAYTTISGKVEKGDVLVTGVGTIGVPLLIKSDKPLYFKDGNIIWFKNKNKIDGYFFYYSFIGNTIQKFIGDVAGIGTVGTYTIDSGKNTPILLPKSKEEQILIGNFLKTLDNSITLQQQKLDKLKDLKKAYLNELFV